MLILEAAQSKFLTKNQQALAQNVQLQAPEPDNTTVHTVPEHHWCWNQCWFGDEDH